MDEEKGYLLIVSAALAMLLLVMSFFMIVAFYRRQKINNREEKKMMAALHQQEMLDIQLATQQLTMQDIGREIHDNVGQKLTLASLYVQQVTGTPDHSRQLIDKLRSIGSIIDESLTDLRSLSRSLVADHTGRGDLMPLLHQEVERINAAGACVTTLSADVDSLVLDAVTMHVLHRMVQESLQNALKHAGATNIGVAVLAKHNHLIELKIEDNGKGFSLSGAGGTTPGVGLANLRKRASMLQAELSIKTAPRLGTAIKISLPKPTQDGL